MKDWEKAEAKVAELIKGRRTPGSGNKGLRGDVRSPGRVVEVKQTASNSLTIKSEWMDELIHLCKNDELKVAFAIFFELRGHVYYLDEESEDKDYRWKTMNLKEGSLPDYFWYQDVTFRREELSSLRSW